ncbi:MAG: sigma-54-dependent Fis family transcriptional regulator [Acidobacteria bacterium]|nr:sigma-54-dependent Fis family transcriptional regulator [Acidobacteriota bacterium]
MESHRPVTLLSVDDDPLSLELISHALEQPGLRILTCNSPLRALDIARDEHPQIVLLDLMMPGMSGLELLKQLVAMDPTVDVILLTAHYSTEAAVEAIQYGACDYLNKPLQVERLQERVGGLIAEWRRRNKVQRLDAESLEANQFQGIIGHSALMLEVFARLRRIGPHFQTALITGPTGTGKELVAQALHRLSPVASGPFVICNCAAIPENLVESELFGHLKGSFTGAISDKTGLFEAAHNGVLFLDELGELPLAAQAKLLRAIQQQEIQRIGATHVRKVNVRIVAATNRDLLADVERKAFREDLFFRLSMVEVKLPPLASRPDDIPLLIRHFIRQFSTRYGKEFEGLRRRAEALLVRYHWPGNVRDLENAIGYACMMAEPPWVDVNDLPSRIRTAEVQAPGSDTLLVTLDEIQRLHAQKVLAAVGGNKVKAAGVLGVSRATLYRLLSSGGTAASGEDGDHEQHDANG